MLVNMDVDTSNILNNCSMISNELMDAHYWSDKRADKRIPIIPFYSNVLKHKKILFGKIICFNIKC